MCASSPTSWQSLPICFWEMQQRPRMQIFVYICSPESLCCRLLHAYCPRSDNDQGLRMRRQNEKKEFCIPKGDYYTFTWSHTCFVAWFCTSNLLQSLSLSLSSCLLPSLTHTYFPIRSQFVFNVFSMCPAIVSFLPCLAFNVFSMCPAIVSFLPCLALPPNQAVLTVLICSLNFSHTPCQMFLVLFPEFPFIPRVVPSVPTHPHGVPNSPTAASSNVSSTQFEFWAHKSHVTCSMLLSSA